MSKIKLVQIPFDGPNKEEELIKPDNYNSVEQELINQLKSKGIDTESESIRQFLASRLSPEFVQKEMAKNAQVADVMAQADSTARLGAAAQLASDKAFTTQQGILTNSVPNSRDLANEIEGMSASNAIKYENDLNNKIIQNQTDAAKVLFKDNLDKQDEINKRQVSSQKFQVKNKFLAESKNDRDQLADMDSIGRFLATGNPVLQANAQFRIARSANGTGVLTQQDFEYAAKGDPSLANMIATTWGKYMMGEKISPRDVQLLSQAVPELKASVRRRLDDRIRTFNHAFGDLGFSGDDLYRYDESLTTTPPPPPSPTKQAYDKLNPPKKEEKQPSKNHVDFEDFIKGKR